MRNKSDKIYTQRAPHRCCGVLLVFVRVYKSYFAGRLGLVMPKVQ